MGRVEGKVAFITGAARGQGRAHAVRLAQEGADVVITDALTTYSTIPYHMPTMDDLEETAQLVREAGQKVMIEQVDVRNLAALEGAVDRANQQFGGIDILVANAGIVGPGAKVWEIPEAEWDDIHDVNLKGVWNTTRAAIPSMIKRGKPAAIVIVASAAAYVGSPNMGDYNSSKHGVLGLGRTLAKELAPYQIRVNLVAPGSVGTDMVLNDMIFKLFCPDIENPTVDDARERFARGNPMGIPWLEPVDIANAVLWLASDEARYVTGILVPLDAGATG